MAPNQGGHGDPDKARIPEIHTVRRRTNVKINVPDSRPASSLRRMREIGHEVERGGEPPSRVTRITDTAAGGGPATYEHTSKREQTPSSLPFARVLVTMRTSGALWEHGQERAGRGPLQRLVFRLPPPARGPSRRADPAGGRGSDGETSLVVLEEAVPRASRIPRTWSDLLAWRSHLNARRGTTIHDAFTPAGLEGVRRPPRRRPGVGPARRGSAGGHRRVPRRLPSGPRAGCARPAPPAAARRPRAGPAGGSRGRAVLRLGGDLQHPAPRAGARAR